MMKSDDLIEVAKIGKVVGLKGDLKLYNLSDFGEQFKSDSTFLSSLGEKLTIAWYDEGRELVHFVGIDDRTTASRYVNATLQTTQQATRDEIKLDNDEFFWFDIIGCVVYDDELLLGDVDEIERIGITDYLVVKSDKALQEQGYEKSFLIPYVDRYIKSVSIEDKKICTIDARYLLEKRQ